VSLASSVKRGSGRHRRLWSGSGQLGIRRLLSSSSGGTRTGSGRVLTTIGTAARPLCWARPPCRFLAARPDAATGPTRTAAEPMSKARSSSTRSARAKAPPARRGRLISRRGRSQRKPLPAEKERRLAVFVGRRELKCILATGCIGRAIEAPAAS
jgi:hypothetical protein